MTSKVILNIPQNAESLLLNVKNNRRCLTSVRIIITNLSKDGPTGSGEVVYDKVHYIAGNATTTLEYALQQIEYSDPSAPTVLQVSISSASNSIDACYSYRYRN